MKKRSSVGQWLIPGVVVIAAVALGLFIWRKAGEVGHPPAAVAPPSAASAGTGPAAASTVIRHPIAQAAPASAATAPLPPLDASDADVATALLGMAGGDGAGALLQRDQVIRRIVATVDALPRQNLASNLMPVKSPQGAFIADQAGENFTLSARNAERYAPYMRVLESVDPQALVAWYARHYPLFQQAYQDLGYPHGYFNDRLVVAIDDMLAAPELQTPAALTRPKVFYRYADPSLEARSAGQKMMMRLGPADEARVKAKLRAIRARLTGAALAPAASAG